MLQTSEGGGTSLVALPASLCEENIKLLVVDTFAAKLPGLCVDDGEILFEDMKDLTVADVLLAEGILVLLSALLIVILGELTCESHCC